MIFALFTSARAWFGALPVGLRWLLAGVALTIALAAAWAVWLSIHDGRVIHRHEQEREDRAADARAMTAEERAADAIRTILEERDREAAIARAEASEAEKPIDQRATLPPTTVALNCARLRQAYSAAELAKMRAYQEVCL